MPAGAPSAPCTECTHPSDDGGCSARAVLLVHESEEMRVLLRRTVHLVHTTATNGLSMGRGRGELLQLATCGARRSQRGRDAAL